jgi:hypothetical protein
MVRHSYSELFGVFYYFLNRMTYYLADDRDKLFLPDHYFFYHKTNMHYTAYSGENGPLVRAKWASRWKWLGGGVGNGFILT